MVKADGREARLAASVVWLVAARWSNFIAQAASVLVGHFLLARTASPLAAAILIGCGIGSNALAGWWIRHRAYRPVALVSALIGLDALLLTLLLASSGGAMNTLSIMYLVYITTAAVVLTPRWTWLTMAVCTVCFGALFLMPLDTEFVNTTDMNLHLAAMRMHVQSMWWSFLLAAIITAYFGSKLSQRLGLQSAELAEARQAAERNQRLASLTTLAAGAAHELSTPLATIAIAAEELERSLADARERQPLLEDVLLIKRELRRCRETLNRMSTDAGQSVGEGPTTITAGALARAAISTLSPADATRVVIDGPLDLEFFGPAVAISQALANLLRNALDSDPSRGPVMLTVQKRHNIAAFLVKDGGVGMDAEALERAGEPFFTTKPVGRGMGLGVFLARTVVEQIGGRVRFDSAPGTGTLATIELPTRVAP